VALALVAHGVKPGDFVAVSAPRSMMWVVGMLGVFQAGAAYVPLDPAYPKERLKWQIEDSDVAALIYQQGMAGADLTAMMAGRPCLPLTSTGLWPSKDCLPSGVCLPDYSTYSPERPAYMIYTSGSTGLPKGVVVSHHNVVRLLSSTQPLFHFSAQDVWTLFHSCAFDFSVWEVWGALCSGGRLVVVPWEVSRQP